MTTGQRIAAKRKEQELSQEALGETLGVSRQSIYKWESDSSLPEIDKLVAMSRLFHVSVGWLLGVEEEPEAPDRGTLSESQMKLVEEILSRYQQASQSTLSEEQQAQVNRLVEQKLEQKPKSPWDKWSVRILFAICGFMVATILSINSKINRSEQQYNDLANSVNNVTYSVDRQIGTITNRVEEVLKGMNDLTADYGTELVSADLAQNTVTFSLRAVPKTYVEGMEVVFLADTGDGPEEFPGHEGPGREFMAEITCALTDSITLSAVFVHGDTRQTQLLDNYSGLYQSSMPQMDVYGLESVFLNEERGKDGLFHLPEASGWLRDQELDTKFGAVEIRDLKVGLFQNFQLVTWLEPCEQPKNYNVDAERFFRFDAMDMDLKQGDILHFAAVYTDQYGRQGVAPSTPYFECFGDKVSWPDSSDDTPYYVYSNYKF